MRTSRERAECGFSLPGAVAFCSGWPGAASGTSSPREIAFAAGLNPFQGARPCHAQNRAALRPAIYPAFPMGNGKAFGWVKSSIRDIAPYVGGTRPSGTTTPSPGATPLRRRAYPAVRARRFAPCFEPDCLASVALRLPALGLRRGPWPELETRARLRVFCGRGPCG